MNDRTRMEQLIKALADTKRMGPNTDAAVDVSFDRSRTAGMSNADWRADAKADLSKKQGTLDRARSDDGKANAAAAVKASIPAAQTRGRPMRHPGGEVSAAETRGRAEAFKFTWKTREPKSMDARATIATLGEKMDARSEQANTIKVSDARKLYNAPGPDSIDLRLTEDGRFGLNWIDTKALQKQGGAIRDASALTTNLESGLREVMGEATARATTKDPKMNEAVREVYVIVSETIRGILGPENATPAEVESNIETARGDGRLELIVPNYGGNANRVSTKLSKLGVVFKETRRVVIDKDGKAVPIPWDKLIHKKSTGTVEAADNRTAASTATTDVGRQPVASPQQPSPPDERPPATPKAYHPDAAKPTIESLAREPIADTSSVARARGYNSDALKPNLAGLARPASETQAVRAAVPASGPTVAAQATPSAQSDALPDHTGPAGPAA